MPCVLSADQRLALLLYPLSVYVFVCATQRLIESSTLILLFTTHGDFTLSEKTRKSSSKPETMKYPAAFICAATASNLSQLSSFACTSAGSSVPSTCLANERR